MRRIIIYIAVIFVSVFAQGATFDIQVSVEFISLNLYHLDSSPYTMIITDTLDTGDTTSCDSAGGIWIDNQSNIAVNLISWAYDDSLFCAPDTPWAVELVQGNDTCAIGICVYSSSRTPDISSALWLDETPRTLESGIAAGEDRYAYIYFLAPTDPARYNERQHRIITIIGLAPD